MILIQQANCGCESFQYLYTSPSYPEFVYYDSQIKPMIVAILFKSPHFQQTHKHTWMIYYLNFGRLNGFGPGTMGYP